MARNSGCEGGLGAVAVLAQQGAEPPAGSPGGGIEVGVVRCDVPRDSEDAFHRFPLASERVREGLHHQCSRGKRLQAEVHRGFMSAASRALRLVELTSHRIASRG